jgi:HEPN domain-containing protein
MMNNEFLNAPGELFLGSDRETAIAQGSRHFRSARKALAFAVEQAAPVSLRGAILRVGDRTFEGHQISDLHKAFADGASAH